MTTIRDGLPHVEMAVGDTLDWSRDWSAQLADGEAIAASVWNVPEGLTAGIASHSGAYTTQWLTATQPGAFPVANTMTTGAGRTWVRTLVIDVVERL